jgi:PD-(D/E)XK nuclease superfamily
VTGWDDGLELMGSRSTLKISATDLSTDNPCGRYAALKIRPKVLLQDWGKKLAPWGAVPFVLGIIRDLVVHAHALDLEPADMSSWIVQQMTLRQVPRLVRPYIAHAVENILDAHSTIEDAVGPLQFIGVDPAYPPDGRSQRTLTAWAPVYLTRDGTLEVRRLRLGAAHPLADDLDTHWDIAAAYVAARSGMGQSEPDRVRVVEIGCGDGSVVVRFDGSASEAVERYERLSRPRAIAMTGSADVVPCHGCGDCKAAGACGALVPVDGMLGQPSAGLMSRSVSPSELQSYRQCPGQWLLHRQLHLPTDHGLSPEQRRGVAVHRWLEHAHKRAVACSLADLPDVGMSLGPFDGVIGGDDYLIARPYLQQHIATCPFAITNSSVIGVEATIRGFDATAQLVPVLRPDLIYRIGHVVAIRETKTAEVLSIDSRETAYDRYLQIPFGVQMLRHGLLAHYGVDAGVVELELLTPEGSNVWSWDVSDPMVAAVAAGDVRRAVEQWHGDSTWLTTPGPHCGWCPVNQWCPDRQDSTDMSAVPTADDPF